MIDVHETHLHNHSCPVPFQVDLQRTFTFRNSKQTYTGIPIIAANMDTTGTFEMAQVLSKVSQQYRVEEKQTEATLSLCICLCVGLPASQCAPPLRFLCKYLTIDHKTKKRMLWEALGNT